MATPILPPLFSRSIKLIRSHPEQSLLWGYYYLFGPVSLGQRQSHGDIQKGHFKGMFDASRRSPSHLSAIKLWWTAKRSVNRRQNGNNSILLPTSYTAVTAAASNNHSNVQLLQYWDHHHLPELCYGAMQSEMSSSSHALTLYGSALDSNCHFGGYNTRFMCPVCSFFQGYRSNL